MQTIAQQMITGGVTVLAIVNLDNASGAAIEQQAKKQGVTDHRLRPAHPRRLGATTTCPSTTAKVGELQGQGLQKCLGDKAANIAYLNGSPDDNNATLFSQGAHAVLDKVSNYKKVAEQAVPKWDPVQAATIFEQMYTQTGGKIHGVLAANDTLANAAIQTLKREQPEDPRDRSGRGRRGPAEHPLR